MIKMKCKECGKFMVEETPGFVNASNPPSRWMKCMCGERDLLRSERCEKPQPSFADRWDKANQTPIEPMTYEEALIIMKHIAEKNGMRWDDPPPSPDEEPLDALTRTT